MVHHCDVILKRHEKIVIDQQIFCSELLVLKQEMAIITKQNNKTRLQPKLNLREDLALRVR